MLQRLPGASFSALAPALAFPIKKTHNSASPFGEARAVVEPFGAIRGVIDDEILYGPLLSFNELIE